MTPEEIQAYVDNRIDARMEAIAELAAKKALEHVYADIGKGVLKKLIWLIGISVLALLSWLAGRGYLPPH
jgi:hypothetical protein